MDSDVIVMGNGPSLRGFDFDRLIGKTVFAVNRIHLAYPTTKWRPHVYACVDRSSNPMIMEDLRFHVRQGYPVWVGNYMLEWAFNPQEKMDKSKCWPWHDEKNLIIRQRCNHYTGFGRETDRWHLPHLCSFGGSVWFSVQLAIQEYGAKSISLLGVDGNYEHLKENHFMDGYVPLITYEFPEVANDKNKEQAVVREIAFRECRNRGIPIRDITTKEI